MNEMKGPASGSKVYAPRGLAAAGSKLWDAGIEDFEWAQHELAIVLCSSISVLRLMV